MAFKFQHILTFKKTFCGLLVEKNMGWVRMQENRKSEAGEESALGQSVTKGEKQGEMGKLCSNT